LGLGLFMPDLRKFPDRMKNVKRKKISSLIRKLPKNEFDL
jgi:hypothetical protein